MAWIKLSDFEGNESLKMIADFARIRFNDPANSAKAVKWAFYRYSPDVTLVDEDLDVAAARSAGLHDDESFMKLLRYSPDEEDKPTMTRVNPVLQSVAIDVIQAMGGSDFRRWLVGREHLANCYTEVLSPMIETDEDKRAGVLLKRGELFQKVSDIENALNKLGELLFKKDDSDTIEHLARFSNPEGTAKSAYGSDEGEGNDD